MRGRGSPQEITPALRFSTGGTQMPVIDFAALAAVVQDLGEKLEAAPLDEVLAKIQELEADKVLLDAELRTAYMVYNRRRLPSEKQEALAAVGI